MHQLSRGPTYRELQDHLRLLPHANGLDAGDDEPHRYHGRLLSLPPAAGRPFNGPLQPVSYEYDYLEHHPVRASQGWRTYQQIICLCEMPSARLRYLHVPELPQRWRPKRLIYFGFKQKCLPADGLWVSLGPAGKLCSQRGDRSANICCLTSSR